MDDYDCVIFLSQKDKKKGTFLFYDPFTRDKKITIKNQFDVEFDAREDGEYVPLRIRVADKFKVGPQDYIQHKKFYAILRDLNMVYFVQSQLDKAVPVKKHLKRYQIKFGDAEFCRFCLLENKLTRLSDEQSCNNFGEIICINCAMDELQREMKYSGFVPNAKFLNVMRNIIKRIKDLQKVIPIFQGRFNAARHKDLTLYDRLEGRPQKIKSKKVEEVEIPNELKEILEKNGINEFLPIQNLAIESGLLRSEDLLVVSSTSTGKTLIGELAGVSKILHERHQDLPNKSLIFLNPLRAICNQEKQRFQARYGPLKIRTAIRVGMSHINVKNEDLVIIDDDLKQADIITATYEGFDYVLRQGNFRERIKEPNTVVIDEIQTLGDPERGPILDGLIARIRTFFPKAQIIGLSATIKNAREIAQKLKLKPVIFPSDDRPVPIDRHLVLCKSESEKIYNIANLIKVAYKKGKFGHFGTTIVFTNARLRTHLISRELSQRGIRSIAYHAGLTFFERKRIEQAFERGQVQAIVTTYALGAGFDAPAYQVIFESLYMGIEELSPNMFLQMSGRAGRYGMHEKGEVYVLAEIGKSLHSKDTEDQIALKLLNSGPEDLQVGGNPDEVATEILASLSAGISNDKDLPRFYNNLLHVEEDLTSILKFFKKNGLVDAAFKVTELGRAVSLSFFSIEEASTIIKELKRAVDPLEIAILSEFFDNIYITSKMHSELVRIFKTNIPTKFFAGTITELTNSYKKSKKKIPMHVQKLFGKWQNAFFDCECPKKEECLCGFIKTNRTILELRMEDRRTPKEISDIFKREYQLDIYSGDLLRFLDGINHKLRGIGRIALALGKKEVLKEINKMIRKIEDPYS
ncbi:MAG: DUF5814 domain-containing protein [Candidatus Helarchaeota archaeon]